MHTGEIGWTAQRITLFISQWHFLGEIWGFKVFQCWEYDVSSSSNGFSSLHIVFKIQSAEIYWNFCLLLPLAALSGPKSLLENTTPLLVLLSAGKVHPLSSQLRYPLSTFTLGCDFACSELWHFGCSNAFTTQRRGSTEERLICVKKIPRGGHGFEQKKRVKRRDDALLLQVLLHTDPIISLVAQTRCQSAC